MAEQLASDGAPPVPGTLRDRWRAQVVVPVIVAPMFLCSRTALAIAACASGVVGTLTLNHHSDVDELDAQIAEVQDGLDLVRDARSDSVIGPLAVNTSLGLDEASTDRLLEACHRHGVEVLITANGDPRSFIAAAHDASLRVVHDVTSMRFAHKALAAGVDGMVVVGAGGGGHSGTVSALAFVPTLRAVYDGLIVLAGSVTNGAMVRAPEVLGADLAYVGTRFIATQESMAPAAYKSMLVEATAEDLAYTPVVHGVAANWLLPSLHRAGLDPATMERPAGRDHAHLPPDVQPWRDLWSAGQGVTLIDDIPPAAKLVERLRREYVSACHVPDLSVRRSGRRLVSGARVVRSDCRGVTTLTLNRPEKLNALDSEAFDAHHADLEQSAPGEIRCTIIRGAGKAFCAGADLHSLNAATRESAIAKSHFLLRLERLAMPTVAVVHGYCIGGGIELMLCADLVVASVDAVFIDAHGRHGLVPAWGMSQRLPRRVGPSRAAKYLAFTGRAVSGQDAASIGLVDIAAPSDELDEYVDALAADIARSSWFTSREFKRLLGDTHGVGLAQGLAAEHFRQQRTHPATEGQTLD